MPPRPGSTGLPRRDPTTGPPSVNRTDRGWREQSVYWRTVSSTSRSPAWFLHECRGASARPRRGGRSPVTGAQKRAEGISESDADNADPPYPRSPNTRVILGASAAGTWRYRMTRAAVRYAPGGPGRTTSGSVARACPLCVVEATTTPNAESVAVGRLGASPHSRLGHPTGTGPHRVRS